MIENTTSNTRRVSGHPVIEDAQNSHIKGKKGNAKQISTDLRQLEITITLYPLFKNCIVNSQAL